MYIFFNKQTKSVKKIQTICTNVVSKQFCSRGWWGKSEISVNEGPKCPITMYNLCVQLILHNLDPSRRSIPTVYYTMENLISHEAQ